MDKYPSREEIGKILKSSKVIAVVGLSSDPSKTSFMVSEAMQKAGYKIVPVNPTVDTVLGEKSYASLLEIPFKVDIVNVFRRPEHLLPVAEEFIKIDCDVFFAQLGIENDEAYDLLKQHGKTVIMNRCIKVEHALTK
ncbi:CoA-binding protein [Bacillus sp. RG28]|uniref:CoA-binding protein n=1 Tax=Gottfriedia endophytica TaxID=2820819 RepID=A0A940NIB2_9BACI|nr:CoA-binding protein [Gottfriedia endophytica]MBP0725904.1 CoA-binding protein [Gottfriedia endophytica]